MGGRSLWAPGRGDRGGSGRRRREFRRPRGDRNFDPARQAWLRADGGCKGVAADPVAHYQKTAITSAAASAPPKHAKDRPRLTQPGSAATTGQQRQRPVDLH